MRDYSKISPVMWTRGSGKRLRGDAVAQLVAVYLSTAPGANMIGIYYCPIDTISHDTGHPVDVVREALLRIERAGYAKYDHAAELAWVPNHAKIEIGPVLKPGDKRRHRVLAELAQVSDHPFADEFVARYATAYDLLKGHRRGIDGASGQMHGASGDVEQIRSDQDRSVTDQDRTSDSTTAGPMVPTEATGSSGARTRGSRLPDGWRPSEATQAWARERGVADPCGKLLDEFTDYWRSVAGQRGVKLDWDATYRNRVRQVAEQGSGRSRRGSVTEITKQPVDPTAPWLKLPEVGDGTVG